jgi:hypothetical protein
MLPASGRGASTRASYHQPEHFLVFVWLDNVSAQSTHSTQMNADGLAISLRTACWLLPQNKQ